MNTHDDERDLRERFVALRASDAELDPGYGPIRSAVPRRAVAVRWAPVLAAAAAALGALWLSIPDGTPRSMTPEPTPALALGGWTMPTDVLLDLSGLPGNALLRELPDLGSLPPDAIDGARSARPTPNRRHTT